MKKRKVTINLDEETLSKIDKAAKYNGKSISNISRMLLHMINYIPSEDLNETNPIPGLLGLNRKSEKINNDQS